MHLAKDDISVLDGLLSLMIKRDANISADDLQSFEKHKNKSNSELINEFKRVRYFFEYFGCGDPKDDGGLSEWINPNLSTVQFEYTGGFKTAFENLKKDADDEKLEKELKLLQKENLEYSKTIRDQESRIRDLNEELKFMNLIKQYWWFIGACIGLGLVVREFLELI